MKKTIASVLFLLAASAAFAGDNGSYLSCKSSSGRTQLLIGSIGTLKVDESGKTIESVLFSIDGKSYGTMEVDKSVFKRQIDDITVRYIEAAGGAENAEGEIDMLTVGKVSDTRMVVVSGLDPRTNKSLTHSIQLKCKTVYNPI